MYLCNNFNSSKSFEICGLDYSRFKEITRFSSPSGEYLIYINDIVNKAANKLLK